MDDPFAKYKMGINYYHRLDVVSNCIPTILTDGKSSIEISQNLILSMAIALAWYLVLLNVNTFQHYSHEHAPGLLKDTKRTTQVSVWTPYLFPQEALLSISFPFNQGTLPKKLW